MTRPKANVRNAADPDQVRRAGMAVEFRQLEAENDLRAVLATYEGRRFLWAWLGKLGVNESVFETSARIYYRSGRQDAGHELLAAIMDADAEAYLLMQADAIARERAKEDPKSRDELDA